MIQKTNIYKQSNKSNTEKKGYMKKIKQNLIFLFLIYLILFLLIFLFLPPTFLSASDISELLKSFSYPDRVSVITASDKPEIAIIAENENEKVVFNLADSEPVTIGSHIYMFHKSKDLIKIRYVKQDTKEVAIQPLKDNFISDDGYTIKPLKAVLDTNIKENILLSNENEQILYKTEKSNNKIILKKIVLKDKADIILVLKNGLGNKINHNNFEAFTIDSEFSIGNLTGYVVKAEKEIPFDVFFDCQTEKEGETIYLVCPDKPDFNYFSQKLSKSKEVQDVVICKKPSKECVNEKGRTKIYSLFDDTWYIAETDKYYGFISKDELKNWQDKQAEKELLSQVLSLDFRNVPLKDAIVSLCAQAKVNIILDKEVDPNLLVTAAYEGVSLKDAIKTITYGLDLTYKKQGSIFIITPFEEKYIDVNKLLSEESITSSTSASQPVSGTNNATTTQGIKSTSQTTSTSPGDTTYGSDFGGYIDDLIINLQKILSPKGVITYMPSGFIYVKDYPSYVRAVERMLKIDDERREEINLKITLVRVDYKKEYATGVDWSVVLGGAKDKLPVQIDIGTKFLGNLIGDNDVASIKIANSKNNISSIIKAMSEYGDIDIVHTWETRAISGTILPFELTQDVWYSQGKVVQIVENQTITSDVISKESVGLKILLNPLLQQDGKYLVNTKIELSNIVGFQKIGEQEMPQTERNFLKIPIKMDKEDMVVISGFKIKNQNSQSSGIPVLAKVPVLKYLFGYTKTTDRLSELSVIISIGESKKGQQNQVTNLAERM